MNSSLYCGASHVLCLVRLWMLPSLPTLTFSVYMFTLLLTVLEKTVIKKIETVTLTSLTKIKSVDVLFRRENHKINPLPALNTD